MVEGPGSQATLEGSEEGFTYWRKVLAQGVLPVLHEELDWEAAVTAAAGPPPDEDSLARRDAALQVLRLPGHLRPAGRRGRGGGAVKIDVVSASAGTGKTYRLTGDLATALLDGSARPEGVVAITYTVKAAGELESRIRARLLEEGRADLAARVRDGYIGTIHSVCQRLLREFSLEAGHLPVPRAHPGDGAAAPLRRRALRRCWPGARAELNELARRLELEDWKAQLLADRRRRPRPTAWTEAALQRSAAASRAGLAKLLGKPTIDGPTYLKKLKAAHAKLQPKLDELAAGTVPNAPRDGPPWAGSSAPSSTAASCPPGRASSSSRARWT